MSLVIVSCRMLRTFACSSKADASQKAHSSAKENLGWLWPLTQRSPVQCQQPLECSAVEGSARSSHKFSSTLSPAAHNQSWGRRWTHQNRKLLCHGTAGLGVWD